MVVYSFQIQNNSPILKSQSQEYCISTLNKAGDGIRIPYNSTHDIYISSYAKSGFILPNTASAQVTNRDPLALLSESGKKIMVLGFSLTQRCNLSCKYCYAQPQGEKELDEKTVISKIDAVGPRLNSQISVVFTGDGENTLRMDLIRTILAHLKGMGIAVRPSITTNGFISDDTVRYLTDNFEHVNISFDGLPEIHDRYRVMKSGGATSGQVLSTIGKFKKLGKRVNLTVSLQPEHLGKIEETLKYLHDLDPGSYFFNHITDLKERTNPCPIAISDYIKLANIHIETAIEFCNMNIHEDQYSFMDLNGIYFPRACARSIGVRYYINSSGYDGVCVTATNELQVRKYHLDQTPIILNGNKDMLRPDMSKFRKCLACDFVYFCLGGCLLENFANNKDIYEPNTSYCQVANRARISEATRILANNLVFKTTPYLEVTHQGVRLEFRNFSRKLGEDSCYYHRIADQAAADSLLGSLDKINAESNKLPMLLIDYDTEKCGSDPIDLLPLFRALNQKRVSYRLMRPLPKCISSPNLEREIKMCPKTCRDCLALYVKDGSSFILCDGTEIPFDVNLTRDDIYARLPRPDGPVCHKSNSCIHHRRKTSSCCFSSRQVQGSP